MPLTRSIHATVRRGIESFEFTVNTTTGDRCEYGLLAHCTLPTGEHYVASCSDPDEDPEVLLYQPLDASCVTVEDVEFTDEPEPEVIPEPDDSILEGDEIPDSDEDDEGEGEDEEDPADSTPTRAA